MAILSPLRKTVRVLDGLPLVHRGKVRDTYDLGSDHLLVVATDGISIFDFVLNALIPEKGYVLAAMSHFSFKYLESKGIKTHMIAVGSGIDPYLPPHLRGDIDLQRRAMVVRKLSMILVEFIQRNCLTGSVLSEYKEKGTVYGIPLPEGLQDGDELPRQLFTPTTKAEEGHDEPMDAKEVLERYREEVMLFDRAFREMTALANKRGIKAADGKGELGRDVNGVARIGDEFFTADSNRFWDAIVWNASRKQKQRKAPPPFDKQLAREWGISVGINKLDPKNPDHVAQVHLLELPAPLIAGTTQIYRYICWRLTGQTLEAYTRSELEVQVPLPRKRVAIVAGSESDLPAIGAVVECSARHGVFDGALSTIETHVISCHRNPVELNSFAEAGCGGADVVICAGGKALALPGVLDALLYAKGKSIPVIGVALAPEGSVSEQAAVLSIEELPGNPVVIDEMKGSAYVGGRGLLQALLRVAHGEMPPPQHRPAKPARLSLDLSEYYPKSAVSA